MIDVKASDKGRLLEHLSTEAVGQTGLAADEVVREIAKREELGSTGVRNGVALPHARLSSLKAPFALFARLRRDIYGIDFGAIDGEPVDIEVLRKDSAALLTAKHCSTELATLHDGMAAHGT